MQIPGNTLITICSRLNSKVSVKTTHIMHYKIVKWPWHNECNCK